MAQLMFSVRLLHCMYNSSFLINIILYSLGNPPQLLPPSEQYEKYSPRNDHLLMALYRASDYYLQFVSAAHGYGKTKQR